MDAKKVEEQLAQTLTEGEMERVDTNEAARKRLPLKTEIRIPAKVEPLVEETKLFRQMAEEVDDRYDRVVDRNDSKKHDKS